MHEKREEWFTLIASGGNQLGNSIWKNLLDLYFVKRSYL